jgi:hypothetical protein
MDFLTVDTVWLKQLFVIHLSTREVQILGVTIIRPGPLSPRWPATTPAIFSIGTGSSSS